MKVARMRLLVMVLVLAAPGWCVDLLRGDATVQYPETCAGVQSALNAAMGGDIIELKAGTVYDCGTTTIRLPKHAGTKFVTVRTSRFRSFPDGNTRICVQGSTHHYVTGCTPNVAAGDFATLEWGRDFAFGITARAEASYWIFLGLELRGTSNVTWSTLFSLEMGVQQSGTSIRDRAHGIVVDRCWLHGYLNQVGPQKGIQADGSSVAIRNSAIEEFKHPAQDGQGIFTRSGPGPLEVINSFLAGGAENFMAGGARSIWKGSMPSDLYFIGNYSSRDPRWWIHVSSNGSDPQGECTSGRYWQNNVSGRWFQCVNAAWRQTSTAPPTNIYTNLKNLFELKGMRKATIEGNVFDNHWVSAQAGAVLLVNASAVSNGYLLTLDDVTFRFNRVSNSASAVGFGEPGITEYRPPTRVHLEHNLFDKVLMAERANADPKVSNGLAAIFKQSIKSGPYGFTIRRNSVVRSDQPATYHGGSFYTYGVWSTTGKTRCPYCRFLDNVLPWNLQTLTGESGPGPGVFFSHAGNHSWDYGRAAGNVFSKDGRTPPASHVQELQAGTCCGGNYVANAMGDVLAAPGTDNRIRVDGTGCGGSNCAGKATDGGDPGADSDTVSAMTSGAADGRHNPYLRFRLGSWVAGADSATIYYQAPAGPGTAEGACAVTVSLTEATTTPAGVVSDQADGLAHAASVSGLTAGQRYYYSVKCGRATRRGELRTRLQ